ncbi:MAG: adenylyltransferase/cytidyltransferase family protein [Candidatus Staskawiczbacteria bacterium]|jgi:cytidyltransferase-like protein
MKKATKSRKIIITSGYYNPLHIGHINCLKEAKKVGDFLIVIVNNDEQVKIKGSVPFMPEQERIEIIKALKYPDEVILSIDKDSSVIESLKAVARTHPGELFFAKGGDRNSGNIPEKQTCDELGIKIINNVGGDKVQSSSLLLNKLVNPK